MVSGLLSGLRVLDLTRFVSGSQATMLLAAMGADVIKVEVPPGDPYRRQGTEEVNGESALFLSLNSGTGSLARHGLDWESVHDRSPALVYGSISGYGDVGPAASQGGFDLILQADSG